MTFLSAYSAYLSGKPFYLVAPYVAMIFAVWSFGIYLSVLGFQRFQTYLKENHLGWLKTIADDDRQRIDQAVWAHDCSVFRFKITEKPPFIQFVIHILNASVYTLRVRREVKGFVTMNESTPLEGKLALTELPHVFDVLKPRSSGSLYLTLWLGEKDVETVNQSFSARPEGWFSFSQIVLTLEGAKPEDEIVPQNLNFRFAQAEHFLRGK